MRDHLFTLVCVLALAAGTVGLAAGAGTPTVGVDAPDSVAVGGTASGSLVVSGVTDPDGVGSFTVNVTYDPAVVSVSASGTSTFDVSTSTPKPGVLRVVGYTGDYPGPDGTVTLAALQVTGDSAGSSALDTSVETLTDADGNPLTNTTSGDAITVTSSGGGSTPTATPGNSGSTTGGSNTGGSSGTSGASGTANVTVTSASLSTTEAAVGESVTVSATAENTGNASGTVDLRLVVDGRDTGDSRILDVPAGATETASLTTTFDAPGEYAVSFGGVTAGTVTVTDGGPAPTATPEPTTATPTATAGPATPTATAESGDSGASTDSPTESGTPTAGQPGFGALAAVLALLAAAGVASRRR